MSGIVIRTLADRALEIVRERIVMGQLPVDSAIRQDALAAELGVSKIPLREALAALENEGLLVSHANRGYFVSAMTALEVEEIYDLRLAIEPRAAGNAARAAGEADYALVREAYARLDTAAATNLAQVAVRNREFHVALVRPWGRPLTERLVERLAILAERYVVAHLSPAGRESRAHIEHSELLNAFCAGDGAAVEAMLIDHIAATQADLREQFR